MQEADGTLEEYAAARPTGRSARVDVLLVGSLSETSDKVVGTCTLVRDAGRTMVVDPGMADGPGAILEPLAGFGIGPNEVTDVVLSHHHPDHTMHAGLFPAAAVHDHWAIYRGSAWESSDADGRELTGSVRLLRVPGHTAEDIATVIGTPEGVVVCTHLWWTSSVPDEDPYAELGELLHANRRKVLGFADLIVPGHGAAFRPKATTPR